MQMTPERERFLHKHIFVGRRDLFARSKCSTRGSGDYHGTDAIIPSNRLYICVVSTPYSTSTWRRGLAAGRTRISIAADRGKFVPGSPVTASEDSNICHVHAQLIHLG